MRKKVLAALLAAAVAGTTVMSGMTAFAAETEGTKAKAEILPLQKQQIRRTSIRFMLWIRQASI